jgi:hypothetical protein
MQHLMSRSAEELRRLEFEIRRAPDAFTRRLREQEYAALRARLAPRAPAKGARA